MCPHQQEYLSEKMTTIPSLYPETNLLRKQEPWKEHGGKAAGFTLFDFLEDRKDAEFQDNPGWHCRTDWSIEESLEAQSLQEERQEKMNSLILVLTMHEICS